MDYDEVFGNVDKRAKPSPSYFSGRGHGQGVSRLGPQISQRSLKSLAKSSGYNISTTYARGSAQARITRTLCLKHGGNSTSRHYRNSLVHSAAGETVNGQSIWSSSYNYGDGGSDHLLMEAGFNSEFAPTE